MVWNRKHKNTIKQAAIYAVVGVFNTFVGLGSVLLFTYFGVLAEVSNILGYVVGILVSYLLNARFTFKMAYSFYGFLKFAYSLGFAYVLNLATLYILYRILKIDVYLAQVLSGCVYTISGFLCAKYFAFRLKNIK